MDIISRLEYTIKISNANISASSWQQQRNQYVDKTIEPLSTAPSQPTGSTSFFSDVWSTIDNIPIVSTIANIIPTGIDVIGTTLKTGFDGVNNIFVSAMSPTSSSNENTNANQNVYVL